MNKPAPLLGRPFHFALVAALAMLAVAYVAKGSYSIVALDYHSDLKHRWSEAQCFLRGMDPYACYLDGGGYPPWAFPVLVLICGLWLPFSGSCIFFLVTSLLCLAFAAREIYQRTLSYGRDNALLFTLTFLAMGSVCNTIAGGQLGFYVLAFLILAYRSHESGKPVASGLWLSLALIKPSITIPFLIPLLFKRRWTQLAYLSVGAVLLSAITWLVTKTDPFTITREMLASGASWAYTGLGLLNIGKELGLPSRVAISVLALVMLSVQALILLNRADNPLVVLALCAVVSRLWTYHRAHDNLFIALLAIPLGIVAVRTRSWVLAAAYLAVGLTLWIPTRWFGLGPVYYACMVLWLVTLAVFLLAPKELRR